MPSVHRAADTGFTRVHSELVRSPIHVSHRFTVKCSLFLRLALSVLLFCTPAAGGPALRPSDDTVTEKKMAAFPVRSASPSVTEEPRYELGKQVRSHEVAIAELNNLSSSRAVYQKNGNLFFRTSIQKAITAEQRQLDSAKAKLQKLSAA
ncbi:hypothetical protein NE237_030410 [Protea cynaroides]|uniref:Uncharacterized protein n=1 Tax=Protea cynaroides TaxID=273540 RepID=A0A9Q0GTP5_9MAGN|nr:hypothetical protein NE237_030410 [Protea cynaroides]